MTPSQPPDEPRLKLVTDGGAFVQPETNPKELSPDEVASKLEFLEGNTSDLHLQILTIHQRLADVTAKAETLLQLKPFDDAVREYLSDQPGIDNLDQPHEQNHSASMTDTPTFREVDAKLEAAEARSQTALIELRSDFKSRFDNMQFEVRTLTSKIDSLVDETVKTRTTVVTDGKSVRTSVYATGIGAIIAILALVIALWTAGISSQANVIASFQAALAVRSLPAETPAPQQPSAVAPPTGPPKTN